MSTNYYLKRIPTKEEIAQCHQLLDERKIDTDDLYGEDYGTPCLQSVLAEMIENVHLGKYSGGWRFLFRTNTNLYGKTIQSCMDYLARCLESGRWRICDEYGKTITLNDFKKLIEDSLDGITIIDYYKKNPEERSWSMYGPQQEIAEDGSRWWDADFC